MMEYSIEMMAGVDETMRIRDEGREKEEMLIEQLNEQMKSYDVGEPEETQVMAEVPVAFIKAPE